jgi:DNA-directed RNA polymerase subunit RPC12/RpoP
MAKLMWNLLEWLDEFVMHSTTISDRWKSSHTIREFWVEKSKRRDKFIKQANFHTEFTYTRIPDDLLVLTENHKQQIKEKIEFFNADGVNNFYSDLWLLTKILSDYEKADALNDVIPQAVLKLREYINELFKQQYPEQFDEVKAVLENIRKGHTEKEAVTCIECGSQNIRSYGDRWKCNACGRTFLKKPRTKHYQK